MSMMFPMLSWLECVKKLSSKLLSDALYAKNLIPTVKYDDVGLFLLKKSWKPYLSTWYYGCQEIPGHLNEHLSASDSKLKLGHHWI